MRRYLLTRLESLESETKAGKIQSIDDQGRPMWIESRGAIMLMRKMLLARRDAGKNHPLVISDYPAELQPLIVMWSRSKPGKDSGQLSKLVKIMCQEIMGPEA